MSRPMIARLATTAALTALALAALPALAQTTNDAQATAPTGPGPMMSPLAGVDVAPLLFAALDADGDGMISPEELAAAVGALDPRMQGALMRGLVDAEDRRAAMAEAMVARLDTDGDGMLSAEELAAGMAARAEQRAAWQTGMRERGKSLWCEDRQSERMGSRQDRRDEARGRSERPRSERPRGDGTGPARD